MKPPLTKSPTAARVFSAATQQCSVWKERPALAALSILTKWRRQVLMQNLHAFFFFLPPLLFYRLPSTTFRLPTKCYRQGLATPLIYPSAAMTRCCPTLPTSESLIFREVTLSTQDNCLDSSSTMGDISLGTQEALALWSKRPV